VYIVAGHKGLPAEVARAGRNGRRRRLKGKRGRGTLAGDKPPVLGLLQRDGEVVIQMLPNVQQVTIQPVITNSVALGSQFYTDEYDIYERLSEWGYRHKKVNHSAGEYARDEDGDGIREVHTNAAEGVWTDVRNYLRPFKGVHKMYLSGYVAMAEFRRNLKRISPAFISTLVILHSVYI
jgi:transposase